MIGRIFLAASVVIILCAGICHSQPTFTAIKFEPFTGTTSETKFISFNARAEVLVASVQTTGFSDTSFFIANESTFVEIQRLPSDNGIIPMDLNNLGEVLTRRRYDGLKWSSSIYDGSFAPVQNTYDPAADSCIKNVGQPRGGFLMNNNRDIIGEWQSTVGGSCWVIVAFWEAGAVEPSAVYQLDELEIPGYFVMPGFIFDLNDQQQVLVRANKDVSCGDCPLGRSFLIDLTDLSKTTLDPFSGITLDASYSDATYRMNDSGWVCGHTEVQTPEGIRNLAVIWKDGQPVLMDSTVTDSISTNMFSEILYLSNDGLGVGNVTTSGGQFDYAIFYNGQVLPIKGQVTNLTFEDGSVIPDFTPFGIWTPTAMNDRGDILFEINLGFQPKRWVLLKRNPEPGPPIVNSTGDLPDTNPGDGFCSTGGITAGGEDECTLRAAIMETNAQEGKDTILFNIAPGGPAAISVLSSMAAISDAVVIDGRSQPGSDYVDIVGSAAPAGKALEIIGANCEIYGLAIYGFSGNALELNGANHCTIAANIIGASSSMDSTDINTGYGIHLINSDSAQIGGADAGMGNTIIENGLSGVSIASGFGNEIRGNVIQNNLGHGLLLNNADSTQIGDADFASQNTISENGLAGVFVVRGFGNTIRRNVIEKNGGLAIDLAPVGVNPNDSADADDGPNRLMNHPVIDSVVTIPLQTRIYGHVLSEPGAVHIVEVFYNDTCPESGYGEGQESMTTTTANAGATTIAPFEAIVSTALDTNQFISLTATDHDGNTSEFGPCWPKKRIRLVDINGNPIPNKMFGMSRVQNNPPEMTEEFIDSVMTDSSGYVVDFEASMRTGDLNMGDSLKFARFLGTGSWNSLAGDFTVSLDNMSFNSLTFAPVFDELDSQPEQDITLGHGTFGLKAVIGIAWGASADYWEETQRAVRLAANYLYDVSDGQIRLDTVWLGDENNGFQFPLFNQNPYVVVLPANDARPVLMREGLFANIGRRWFGPDQNAADQSADEYPLAVTDPSHYRGLARVLASPMLGFESEELPDNVGCDYRSAMGFMGWPYPDNFGGFAENTSEMSWWRNYQNFDCRATEQYVEYSQSCWNWFRRNFEGIYDSIFVPVITPDERNLGGSDYFIGPNNNLDALDYDVGSSIVFPRSPNPRTERDLKLVARNTSGQARVGARVKVRKRVQGSQRLMDQGMTSLGGEIWLVGVNDGDEIEVEGGLTLAFRKAGSSSLAPYSWSSGRLEVDSTMGDTIQMTVTEVQGSFPLVCSAELSANDLTLNLAYSSAFASLPELFYRVDTATAQTTTLADVNSSYSITLPEYLLDSAGFQVTAIDDSADEFFFSPSYAEQRFEDTLPRYVQTSALGDVQVRLDSANFPSKLGILSTSYPVLPTGLAAGEQIVSRSHAVTMYPNPGSLAGDNRLTISYTPSADGGTTRAIAADETQIRIFRWSDALDSWELAGGDVDTSGNTISISIDQAGVYAAFATDIATDVGDDDGPAALPTEFALEQNYPNPFNPTTILSFALPNESKVQLEIFNIAGQRVRGLLDKTLPAGSHQVVWDGLSTGGDRVASGVYFYRLKADDVAIARKMLLVK